MRGEYIQGYKDYVNGFEYDISNTSPDYIAGFYAARNTFMNDFPYDESIVDSW